MDQGKRPNYHSGGHKPRWLDEQTEIPEEEYRSYRTKRPGRSQNDYRVFLPHCSPNCKMTTTFGDLCDLLCWYLRRAPIVGERRRQCRREPASAPAVGGSSNSGAHEKKGHLVKPHRLTIKSSATVAAANDPCISSGSDLGMPQQVISQHKGEVAVTSRPLRTAHVRAKGPPPKETLKYKWMAKTVKCPDCGSRYRRSNRSYHVASQKHLNAVAAAIHGSGQKARPHQCGLGSNRHPAKHGRHGWGAPAAPDHISLPLGHSGWGALDVPTCVT